MKICFFGTRMDLISGHSRPAFELASGLIDRGHDVRIISTSLTGERLARHRAALARSPQLERVPVERPFEDLRALVRDRSRTATTLEALLAGCHLVHGFSYYAMSVLKSLFPLRMPLVLSLATDIRPPVNDCIRLLFQAPFYLRQPHFVAGMFAPSFLLKRSLTRFQRIVCWSGFIQERVRGIGVSEGKTVRIPLSLERSRFDLVERHAVRGTPLFLYAGLLSTLRGIPTLIRAFQRVVQQMPQAMLVIADRGPHTAEDAEVHARERRRLLDTIARSGLGGAILLKEFEEDLSPWFNACDAVVLPYSTTIGYAHPPLTLLEAMAHAKPVISARIGSVPEYIEDGVSGVLTDPGDDDALARAMILLNRDAAGEMGSNAMKRVMSLPGWPEIAARTEAVYTDII